MKNFFALILFLFIGSANAQIHEFGAFLGGSNVVGDVGTSSFINPNEPAFGILYKWNKTPRLAFRFSYTQSTVAGDDAKSTIKSKISRNLSFKNDIKEASVGIEFNFFDFDLSKPGQKTTPYVYTGVSYFGYSQLFFVGKQLKEDYYSSSLAIPMTVGVKSQISDHFILGFEAGARYTFTDDIDGSNPKNPNLATLRFGNLNDKDWYVFTGVTLTYTFGRKPCYCN